VRVGLDVGPARHPATGVAVYVRELVKALENEAPGAIIGLGARRSGPLDPPPGATAATYMPGMHYLAWLLVHADRDARAARTDIAHWTNGSAPLRTSVPFVVTIHDLSVFRMPRRHPVARLATVPLVIAAARRARRVIVPSAATAEDVQTLLRVASGRIVVVPHAARTHGVMSGSERAAVLGALGLRPLEYVLAVGTLEPRKNHLILLAAFERIATERPDLRLVFAGAPGWGIDGFERALAASSVRDRVDITGYVSDTNLDALVRSAGVVAYLSLMEGYGLPVIEAMAAGTPVVTSRASAMPETAGGAAVLVDPKNVGEIARGLERALDEPGGLIDAGLRRAAMRSWRDVAIETLAVYEQAADRTV
jgi:glycosyltransferase involved in cell wall biosynthesis